MFRFRSCLAVLAGMALVLAPLAASMPAASAAGVSPSAAVGWALNLQGSTLYDGLCLEFVYYAYGLGSWPGGGPNPQWPSEYDAQDMFATLNEAGDIHTNLSQAPVGALVFFGPSVYNGGDGHVGLITGSLGTNPDYVSSGIGPPNNTTIAVYPVYMNGGTSAGAPYEGWALPDGSSWLPANASPGTGDAASYLSEAPPAENIQLTPNEIFHPQYTYDNSGGTTWTVGSYGLQRLQGPADIYSGSDVGLGNNVSSGQPYTWTLSLEAPASGSELSQWQPAGPSGNFGNIVTENLVVNSDGSTFVSENPSAEDVAASPGQLVQLQYTLRNTGGTTWVGMSQGAPYGLDTQSSSNVFATFQRYGFLNVGGLQDVYSGSEITLPQGYYIDPGTNFTWTVTLRAPTQPGMYPSSWSMADAPIGGSPSTFGAVVTTVLTVTAPSPVGSTTLLTGPASVGETQPFTLEASVQAASPGGSAPSGNVRFSDGGQVLPGCGAVPLSGGLARCTTSISDGEPQTYVATYGGSTAVEASSSNALRVGVQAGYWVLASSGGVYNFDAPWYGSPKAAGVGAIDANPVVGIAASGSGYDVLRANGGVDNYGAPWHGSLAGQLPSGVHPVGIANDTATGGYWVLASSGGVYNFDAPWYGSPKAAGVGAIDANPVVGIAASGSGYDVLRANGGVDNYGAPWHGSLAGQLPSGVHPVGIANDTATGGYWVLASSGGVYNFDAPWYGSPKAAGVGAIDANPVVGIAASGSGYDVLRANGGVDNYGAPWHGSLAGQLPSGVHPVGIA